jgi:hypothetical protein
MIHYQLGGSLKMRTSNETNDQMLMQSDSSAADIDGNRTFSYLGPNTASLNVRMGGTQTMADGTAIPTWFFGSGFNSDRTVPSPVIEGIEGDTMKVTLRSAMPHSIHFHGLDVDQANDGVPSTSGYVARMRGGGMMNFGRVRGYTNLGSPFTYTFTAPHARNLRVSLPRRYRFALRDGHVRHGDHPSPERPYRPRLERRSGL